MTEDSSNSEIYRAVKDIMRPESLAKNSLQMEVEKELIEDPEVLVEIFNDFFVEKPNKLVKGIKTSKTEVFQMPSAPM